ncbi:hypothetical protein ACFVJR_20065 [Nocardia salmonicida]
MSALLLQILGPTVGLLGGIAGALGVWHAARTKTAAEARAAEADDDIERERLADDRLKFLLQEQRADFDAVLAPIRENVDRLSREMRELSTLFDALRAKYRAAIDYVRSLRSWGRTQPGWSDAPPAPAILDDEIV